VIEQGIKLAIEILVVPKAIVATHSSMAGERAANPLIYILVKHECTVKNAHCTCLSGVNHCLYNESVFIEPCSKLNLGQ
jgi:hypothetical protein